MRNSCVIQRVGMTDVLIWLICLRSLPNRLAQHSCCYLTRSHFAKRSA